MAKFMLMHKGDVVTVPLPAAFGFAESVCDLWVEGSFEQVSELCAAWPVLQPHEIKYGGISDADYVLPAGAFALYVRLCEPIGAPP